MKRTMAALMVVWGITASHAQSDTTVTVARDKIRGALVEGGGAMFKGILRGLRRWMPSNLAFVGSKLSTGELVRRRLRVSCLFAAIGLLTMPDAISAQARVEKNVVYGMYSGLGLLMDVYRPAQPNGIAIVAIQAAGGIRPCATTRGCLRPPAR